jgi:hypothetical protein
VTTSVPDTVSCSMSQVDPLGLISCGCPSASFSDIRQQLPGKGLMKQLGDGIASYFNGVAWGGSALAARAGLLGEKAKQDARDTNGQLGSMFDAIKSHPGQTATAVAAVASKYPAQVVGRLGTGAAISYFFKPWTGIPATFVALYGTSFQEAYEHPDVVAVATIVGAEMCK